MGAPRAPPGHSGMKRNRTIARSCARRTLGRCSAPRDTSDVGVISTVAAGGDELVEQHEDECQNTSLSTRAVLLTPPCSRRRVQGVENEDMLERRRARASAATQTEPRHCACTPIAPSEAPASMESRLESAWSVLVSTAPLTGRAPAPSAPGLASWLLESRRYRRSRRTGDVDEKRAFFFFFFFTGRRLPRDDERLDGPTAASARLGRQMQHDVGSSMKTDWDCVSEYTCVDRSAPALMMKLGCGRGSPCPATSVSAAGAGPASGAGGDEQTVLCRCDRETAATAACQTAAASADPDNKQCRRGLPKAPNVVRPPSHALRWRDSLSDNHGRWHCPGCQASVIER